MLNDWTPTHPSVPTLNSWVQNTIPSIGPTWCAQHFPNNKLVLSTKQTPSEKTVQLRLLGQQPNMIQEAWFRTALQGLGYPKHSTKHCDPACPAKRRQQRQRSQRGPVELYLELKHLTWECRSPGCTCSKSRKICDLLQQALERTKNDFSDLFSDFSTFSTNNKMRCGFQSMAGGPHVWLTEKGITRGRLPSILLPSY